MLFIKRSTLAVTLGLFTLSVVLPAAAGEPTGTEIMKNADERDAGDDMVNKSLQRLINKRGQERKRDSIYVTKDYRGKDGFDDKTLVFIESPAQVKGTGMLMWSYMDGAKDDDQWLYLPALRKVRRLSTSDKEDSFMGTDFTYDDMGDRKVEEDSHKLVKTETIKGRTYYVVESTPKDKNYMYSKRLSWVLKGEWLPVKVDFYDRKARHLKTLTWTGWKKMKGIWIVGKMEMKNHQTGHRTILEMSETKINVGVKDQVFTDRTLERGLREQFF
jgi:outer membrane lipoprotein-sorting protein